MVLAIPPLQFLRIRPFYRRIVIGAQQPGDADIGAHARRGDMVGADLPVARACQQLQRFSVANKSASIDLRQAPAAVPINATAFWGSSSVARWV